MSKAINDSVIVQRTRFNDKFFCSEYAKLLLYEYFHNDELRNKIDDIAHGNTKAYYGDREISGFEGFALCLTPVLLPIEDQLYRIAIDLTNDE